MAYIEATYVIETTKSLNEARQALERYVSISSEPLFIKMIGKISRILHTDEEQLLRRLERMSARVVNPVLIDKDKYQVVIKLPAEATNLEIDGIPHLLTLLAGDIFRTNEVRNIKWVDVEFPPEYLKIFDDKLGPLYGVEGIKSYLGMARTRPLVAVIMQPNVGLNVQEYASLCGHVARAGADIIVDDEVLGLAGGCSFIDRVKTVPRTLSNELSTAKKKVIYFVNAIGWPDTILKFSDDLKETNHRYGETVLTGVHLTPLYGGFSQLRDVRKLALGPIFSHEYGSGLFSHDPRFGVSSRVLAKISWLLGADIIYIGVVQGRFVADDPGVLSDVARMLREGILDSVKIRGAYPAVCGGLNIANISENIREFGQEIVLQTASGVFGYPHFDPAAGIADFRRVINFTLENCHGCIQSTCVGCAVSERLMDHLRAPLQDDVTGLEYEVVTELGVRTVGAGEVGRIVSEDKSGLKIWLNCSTNEASIDEGSMKLTSMPIRALSYLMKSPGMLCPYPDIYKDVEGQKYSYMRVGEEPTYHDDQHRRIVHRWFSDLRRQTDRKVGKYIESVPGKGYRFVPSRHMRYLCIRRLRH
jgi:ribulose 1,5-bisphosphate carboxylase large subunit-like protein